MRKNLLLVFFVLFFTGYLSGGRLTATEPSSVDSSLPSSKKSLKKIPLGDNLAKKKEGDKNDEKKVVKNKLMELVEDFFKHNYRDVTKRETIEWGEPITEANGNRTIHYKYKALIWDKDCLLIEDIFTFDKNGHYVSVKKAKDYPKPAKWTGEKPKKYDVSTERGLREAVEDFFKHNYRDVTKRETIEWGEPITEANGNRTIHYKYKALIWDKDCLLIEDIFTFDKNGHYVSVKKAKDYPKPAKWEPDHAEKLRTFELQVVDENGKPLSEVSLVMNTQVEWKPESQNSYLHQNGVDNTPPHTYKLLKRKTDQKGIAVFENISESMILSSSFQINGNKAFVANDEKSRGAFGSKIIAGQDLLPKEEKQKLLDKQHKADQRSLEIMPVTVVLSRKAVIRGTVRFEDGKPAGKVRIVMMNRMDGTNSLFFSNDQGEYELAANCGCRINFCVESKKGAAPGIFNYDTGDGSKEKRVDFVLKKGIKIHGTGYLQDGKILKDFNILIWERDPVDIGKEISEEDWKSHAAKRRMIFRQCEAGKKREGDFEILLPAEKGEYIITAGDYKKYKYYSPKQTLHVNGNETECKFELIFQPIKDNK